MKACKHNKEQHETGLCWGCKANRKAAYDLTGTHDPEEQKKYWADVWNAAMELRKARLKREFKQKLKYGC